MIPPYPRCRGFSLIEMLVVLAIIGILSLVGVVMIGNKSSGAVRSVMDELEGTISGAHKLAIATGRDVLLATEGDWGGTNKMLMAYGNGLIGDVITKGRNSNDAFHVAVNASGGLLREHQNAGVVTLPNAGWWTTAGTGSANITSVAPFNDANTGFQNILTSAPNLFGGGTTQCSARVSGANKRFTTDFWIEVVGLQNGQPIAGGPMGLLVVRANGAQVYKFYNPGIHDGGNGTWRRI